MELTKKRGRPRRLKEEDPKVEETNGLSPTEEEAGKIVTEKSVKTDSGETGVMSLEGFDMNSLEKYKPYKGREELPAPVIGHRKRGNLPYVIRNGASRFFFNGNKLIAKYRGVGVKTRLAWLYKANKPLHQRIRVRLKKLGIPGA